ncbi:MAG: PKD domain-containing protein [Bacteroidota bacterium]
MRYRVFFLMIICIGTGWVKGQDAQSPSFHGGKKTRTLDLRKPQDGTLVKEVAYDYNKFPGERVAPPPRRKCATEKVEKTRSPIDHSTPKLDFEDWINTIIDSTTAGKRVTTRGQKIYTLPTVIHVISSSPKEDISREQVLSQLKVLNADYRRQNADKEATARDFRNSAVDPGIEFCLATVDPNGRPTDGIHRVSMAGAPFSEQFINSTIKPQTIWNPDKYLNIWVVNIVNGILGFAQFPEATNLVVGVPGGQGGRITDGVVINYIAFGTTGTAQFPFNKGRTATHEIGHWLGLRHVWGDGDCNDDDFCGDTPKTSQPHFNCPSSSISCSQGAAMVQNFMEYTDDACMNLFTSDQRLRMRTILENSPRRKSLLQSNTACRQAIQAPEPNFVADLTVGCAPLSVNFKDRSKKNPKSYNWTFEGGKPATSTERNPAVSYRLPGKYRVTLEVANEGGSKREVKSGFIEVLASGKALPLAIDFEGNVFPPDEVNIFNPDQDFTWTYTGRVSGKGKGRGAMSINNFDNNRVNGLDWFVMPTLNFPSGEKIELSFDVAYASYSNRYTDTLGVFISPVCGGKFESIYYKGGKKLATAAEHQDPFTPQADEWRTERIDLSQYAGNDHVQVAIVGFGGHGNDIFVDNIRIGPSRGPLPQPSFTQSQSVVCEGQEISFKNTSKLAKQYIWTFPGGNPASDTAANPTIRYEKSGTYNVLLRVINENGEEEVMKEGVVVVRETPRIQLTASKTSICLGEEITLTADSEVPFRWELGQGIAPPQGNTLDLKPKEDRIYRIATLGSGRCKAESEVAVRVNPAKQVQVTPPVATICKGESVELKATGASEYFWSPADLVDNPQTAFVEVTPEETTTFTVLGITSDGCNIKQTVEIKVEGGPSSLVVEPSKEVLCLGEATTIKASGAVGYTWTPSVGLNKTEGAAVIAKPELTTTYTVKGLTEHGCAVERDVEIQVDEGPALEVFADQDSVCPGAEVRLSASGASSFRWMGDASLLDPVGSIVYARPMQSSVYRLIGESRMGCVDTVSVMVGTYGGNRLKLTSNKPAVCVGDPVTLYVAGGQNYDWYKDGQSLGQGPFVTELTAEIYQSATFEVFAQDDRGCNASASLTVEVAQNGIAPRAEFTADSRNACAGQEITFTSRSQGAREYYWEFPTGTPRNSVEANPKVTFDTEGTHDVFLTVTGCNGQRSSRERDNYITVSDAFALSLNTQFETICEGSSVRLIADGARSYEWSPAVGLSNIQGSTVIASPTQSVTYTVSGKTLGGCTSTREVRVDVVKNAGEVAIQTISPTICKGETVSLIADGTGTFEWYPQRGLDDPYNQDVFATPEQTTLYTVQMVDPKGCITRDTVRVNVNPAFSFSVSPANPTICPGEERTLSISEQGIFEWSPAYGLNLTTGREIVVFPEETQTYRVQGTDENGCTSVQEVSVIVKGLAAINAQALDPTICMGDTTELIVDGDEHVVWAPAKGLSATSGNRILAFPTETTTYTATIPGMTCDATQQVTIEVKGAGSIDITPDNKEICKGDQLELTASGALTYQWKSIPGILRKNGANALVKPNKTTSFSVRGKDVNGCEVEGSITVKVREGDFLEATASASSFCDQDKVSLSARGASTIEWINAEGLTGSTRGPKVEVNPQSKTMYKVIGTDEYGCKDTAFVEVDVDIPQVMFTVDKDKVDIAKGPATFSFTDQTAGATSWYWDFGDGSYSKSQNPKHLYKGAGSYTVSLTVDNGTCKSTEEKVIVVLNSTDLSEIEEEGSIQLKEQNKDNVFLLSIDVPRDMYLTLRLLDAGGAERIHAEVRVNKDGYTQELDLNFLDKGVYFLQVLGGAETKNFQVQIK